jgi:serine/threonine protein kinase
LNDRYRLVEQLGAGGLADVYRAEDLVLERVVAVKVVRGAVTDDEQPFAKEIAALARLSHPGIIRLYDGGTHDNVAYLVMEFVDGCPLDTLIAGEGPIDEHRTREIGHAVAQALAHAHDVGLVHRDVKPANILIEADGRTRLTDFGIARVIDETLTSSSIGLGTAGYLAPEQVESGSVGPPADIYSLGLVLLECLTATRAFPGTLTESTIARLHRDPPVPEVMPKRWRSLLTAMTHRDPRRRPTASDVAARLRRMGTPVATSMLRADDPTFVLDREGRRWRAAAYAPRWIVGLAAALLILAGVLVNGEDLPGEADPASLGDAHDPAAQDAAQGTQEGPPENIHEALERLERAIRR